ncbi:MAG TPA: DNA-binding response regulator [Chloroflexi bacterium]|nr:DNA-binding response regulator [Chloroflexota bacterium]HBY08318.1 DNA-binding response regulator [Chloroflexota bacterium]
MRVVLADDHSLFRDGIASLLEQAGYEVVAQAEDGQMALDAIRLHKPDLVLLDVVMTGMDGVETLQHIKAEWPQIKVVMLTVSDADEHLFASIRSGANGYILKGVKANEFLEMLAGLERGEAAISRKTAARLISGFQALTRQKETRNKLSGRELETLRLMGHGLSNRAIAEQMFVSENTIKYHIRNILHKLEVQNRTEAVALALREGLIEQK